MPKEKLIKKFYELFGQSNGSEVRIFFAPARVNLIGEHTDYNGGHVFPCAISYGTYAVCRLRDDDKIKIYSANFKENGIRKFSLKNLVNDNPGDWENYPKGVIKTFIEHKSKINKGFETLFWGDTPNEAGLSSSASIELVTSIMLKKMFDLNVKMIDMIKFSQIAENKFVGVNCGIMDQFASGMGKYRHAILLNCSTLDYKYAELSLDDYKIVIANTNKKRTLGDSKYNERRSQCEAALLELKQHLDINALCDMSVAQFEENSQFISDPINKKRAKHAVYENARTLLAIDALNNKKDIVAFGKLMNESHISLRDDYEVTGEHLDVMVGAAWSEPGTIGARMTGAGFGGCTVNVVDNFNVDNFIKNVGKKYFEKIGIKSDFYIDNTGDGAREIF